MILGTEEILRALDDGRIICDPAPQRVEGAHIDVTLGEWTWVWRGSSVNYETVGLNGSDPKQYFDLRRDEYLMTIPPRGFVLAHTREFIGSDVNSQILPVLHTRSTLARWGLSVHQSAGLGDPGFCSSWTLEIVNPHNVAVTLPVGARVGCIVFQQVTGAATAYQPGTRYNIPRSSWTPEAMLPRKGNW